MPSDVPLQYDKLQVPHTLYAYTSRYLKQRVTTGAKRPWDINRSVLRFCTRIKSQIRLKLAVGIVAQIDGKRVQMGKIFSSLRNVGMWHINKSVLWCPTWIKYTNLTYVRSVDQSDKKLCPFPNITQLEEPQRAACRLHPLLGNQSLTMPKSCMNWTLWSTVTTGGRKLSRHWLQMETNR